MNRFLNPVWKKHRGLVWSNPTSDDAILIRAALVRPGFSRLLDIAAEFGIERVYEEWREMQSERSPEVQRARGPVERILANIEKGFSLAAARH